MTGRTVHTGYSVGPTIPATEEPWPIQWENSIECVACDHWRWESCLLEADGLHRVFVAEVVRCVDCHAPRCGHTVDPDPCVDVRHHRGPHIFASMVQVAWRDDPVAQHFGWVTGIPACTEKTCTHGWQIRATPREDKP